ncbi:uncharacterized protein Triagg1_3684 [Trichoderma aggressivum f. europaeum]|uniref:Uncharacterized protein n=1 Tax=Trichoderma aggressivum f. europaeum TaxID=173218 RepID=A0AAE1M0V7_9HYPO|nr:hypothetical protein Triagg1_3684 [Trichoderma aggressivum f. europaeum]
MGLPRAPIKTRAKALEWMHTAPKDIRSPKFLWEEYWGRFNTVQIPVLDTESYFRTAIKLAKLSSDRNDFEKRFRRIIRRRQAKGRKWYRGLKRHAWKENQSFVTNATRHLAVDFCTTGSLKSMLQILDGVAFGFEADEVHIEWWPNGYLSDDEIGCGTQHLDENDIGEIYRTPSEPSDLDVSEAPSEAVTKEIPNSQHENSPSSSTTTEEHLRHSPRQSLDGKRQQHTENENRPKKRVRFTDAAEEGNAAGTDDAVEPDDEPDDCNWFPSSQPIPSTQRAGESPAKKRRRLDDAAEEGNAAGTGNATRPDDDLFPPRLRWRRYTAAKGWKLNRPESIQPDFITYGSSSEDTSTDEEEENLSIASEQAVAEKVPRKRSKPDDEDDDDGDEERRQKRRRTETPESAPTPHVSPPAQQAPDESMATTEAKVDDEAKGRQHKRPRRTSSSPASPRARPLRPASGLNTRSTRRANQPKLWELDDTSKPRLIR